MENLKVAIPNHTYEISFTNNQLESVGKWLSSLWTSRMIALISDTNVNALYGKKVQQAIENQGFKVILFTVPPGEESKSLEMANMLYEQLVHYGFTRKDGVIALGGGVVGDLAGFVASTYMRGLAFVQIPSSLLAQVDSSIGGKTGVNLPGGKNLVGTFYQPDGVLIDTALLETLPVRNLREGIAEIIKTAAIADQNLWNCLMELADERDLLASAQEIIAACCRIKSQVVIEDEKESGKRMILNFGHTIGHAIENTNGYGIVSHGEAVAVGMMQMAKNGEPKKEMPVGFTAQLSDMLDRYSLPKELENWDTTALYKALLHDKKNEKDHLNIVLLESIGQAKIKQINPEEMKDYLEK